MKDIAFHKTLSAIWEFIGEVNRYVDETAPWSLNKEGNTQRLATVLWVLAESIRIISILINPFIPETSENIIDKLGMDVERNLNFDKARNWGLTKPGTSIKRGENLFSKYP